MALRGLTVGSDQTLRLDGARFRNIGLNLPGAVTRIYSGGSPGVCPYTPLSEVDAMIAVCVALKVKTVRIKIFPYWPSWWTAGVNAGKSAAAATAADREPHYLIVDSIIAKFRAAGIGCILNLWFRHATPSDLCGQQIRAGWLVPGSATRTFVQAVTQEVVTRYLNEDAVCGYEWSNEVNHRNDASDATAPTSTWPVRNTSYGTLASYSAANDIFNGSDLADVLSWWYGVVRAIDNQRIVMSGNGPCSYSQPGGTAGISTPLVAFFREKVRDNPSNCGSEHFYGNLGYGSPGFRGFDALLTGARHWHKQEGRAFVLGEFGNQPWRTTSISTSGGVATINCDSALPVDAGDRIAMCGTGTALDHQWLPVSTVNGARSSITVPYSGNVTWSGDVRGLRYIDGDKVARMCDDIINSGTDLALWWMLDTDPSRPVGESIDDTGNDEIRAAILAANTRLGW